MKQDEYDKDTIYLHNTLVAESFEKLIEVLGKHYKEDTKIYATK